jgi:hypothetical protein
MLCRISVVVLALALVPTRSLAAPVTDDERPFAQRAAVKARAGDWNGVAEILQEGYEATGSLRLLAGWAKAEKKSGDCDESLKLYERFFASSPTAAQIESVQPDVDECRAIVAARPEPIDEPTPSVEALPAPATKPWSRDVAGGVLVGTGSALLLVGTGLAIAAELGDARVDAAQTHGSFESRLTRAQRLAYTSYAAFAVGGALAIGGIVRWIVVARRGAPRDRGVSAAPLAGGVFVAWEGRFSLF